MEESSNKKIGKMIYIIVVSVIMLFIILWIVLGIFFPKAPEMSDKYLVGFRYGGSSWGSREDCVNAYVIICTNHDVIVEMPTAETMFSNRLEYEVVYTLKIPDKQYSTIERVLDRDKLYTMDIKGDNGACDGSSLYLDLYDPNEKLLKSCGAYVPTTKAFCDMYDTVMDNIPKSEIRQIREEYIKKASAQTE